MIEPLVERMQSHPLIGRFLFRDRPHVINLFADDIILMLTNPHISLPQDHDILTEYSKI